MILLMLFKLLLNVVCKMLQIICFVLFNYIFDARPESGILLDLQCAKIRQIGYECDELCRTCSHQLHLSKL